MIALNPAAKPPAKKKPEQFLRRPKLVARTAGLGLAALVMASAGHQVLHHSVAQAAAPVPLPAAIPVLVATVEQRDTVRWDDFSGRMEAVDHIEIRPRAAGTVVQAHFREGAMVRQGDLLFTIDPVPYAVEAQRQEAHVAAAAARLAVAVMNQQRAQQLVGAGTMSQRDADQRVNELHVAEANLRATQAALATARLNLGYSSVRAPISGRVGRIEVSRGNLVGAGPAAPVLTTLVSVNPIYASFEADEQFVARILAGLPDGGEMADRIGHIPVQMGTLGSEHMPFQGALQLIDNVVGARSGMVQMRATFDNPDGMLMPGQFARLRLGQAKTEPVLAIHERAIGTDQDRRFVMVVGDDDTVAYREVRLGATADGLRLVTSGLNPGERVVVDGLERIEPGATVAPQPVSHLTNSHDSR